MKHTLNIWVVGGDQRQASMAALMAEDGHTVHTYALDRLETPITGAAAQADLTGAVLADCVVLPLPVADEEARLNAPLSAQSHPLRGLAIHDYFAREELAVANAVPTVEGAIQIAMEALPITLHNARVLVIGYGRLGRLLAHRLDALGARVSASARSWADLAWIEALGYGVEHTGQLKGWLCSYDLVINTVPAPVLDREALADLKPECLVIDLASKPGGVDLPSARALGVEVIQALSLPGRVAPVTAGRSVKNTVYNILHELGV